MTYDELQQQLKAKYELIQNQFIDKLYEQIIWLADKINLDNYIITAHEKDTIEKIENAIKTIKEKTK